MEDADADGGVGIVKTHCEEVVLAIKNNGQLTGVARAVLFADTVGKQPWVTGTKDGFSGGGDPQTESRARIGRCV